MYAVGKVGIVALALLGLLGANAGAFVIAPALTGARVTAVWPGSPAQRIGLEPGDVIVAIDNQPVRTLAEFNRLVENSGRRVSLIIRNVRNGQLVQADAFPVNGRIGVQFQIITMPNLTIKDLLRAGLILN
jgi:S1-C subfamily serine protease